jgi:hypothetical protein
LRAQAAEFYEVGIQKLVPRLNKWLGKGGNYVEKWLKLCVKEFLLHFLINIFIVFLSVLSGRPTYKTNL